MNSTPTPSQFLEPAPVALYRHIDRNGELLYIGITADPRRRWLQHVETSFWARFVADTSVGWVKDRESAMGYETRAITHERPLFNVARRPGPPWERRRPIVEHQLAYLRTGVSGLPRRPRCQEHGQFHVTCGPDADAWLETSFRASLAAKGY